MPSWSDDEGRCHFDVDGTPCYQSWGGCPMHRVKPQRKRKQTPQQDAVADAYRRGVAAMREAAAVWVADFCSFSKADRIRALPDPEDKP